MRASGRVRAADAVPAGGDGPTPPSVPGGVRAVFVIAGPALPVVSFLARLPAALCPTGTLLMVTALGTKHGSPDAGAGSTAGGIGVAGVLAGLLWVGQAAGGPVIGRLADRRGHRPVLCAASAANAVATLCFVASVLATAPLAVRALLAAATGLTVPQVGPLSRTRWIALAGDGPRGRVLVRRALSFDTTVDEISFVAGPALAGVCVLLFHPVAGLLLAAAAMAVFGVLFAVHPTAPAAVRPVRAEQGRPLLSARLVLLFVMALAQGLILGGANAGTNALAGQLGSPGAAGLVWGAMGVTSALAGLATTALPSGGDATVRLRLAIVAQAVLALPLLVVDDLVGATAALALLGVAVAPHLIAVFALGERVAPAQRMGEAMTVLGTGLIVGQGLAATAAGELAARHGHTAGYALSCAVAVAASAVALVCVRSSRRGDRGRRPWLNLS